MEPRRLIVTDHAIARYIERLGGTADAARAALSGRAVQAAVDFGARAIRVTGPTGVSGRIILEFNPVSIVVVTVLPIGELPPRTLRPSSLGGPMPIAREQALFLQHREPQP
jgi:hypothetical protein